MALGARSADVLRRVTRQGAQLALLGMTIGAVGAFALSRVLERFLYGVTARDGAAFAMAAAVLGVAALLASYIPARRASRVDPMVALRGD
jgi:ABC-type antimicrobial peptide transport system permease subunit